MSTVILLSNDDGYEARGIQLLHEALDGLGELFIAAPDDEQSASSHSLTLRNRIATDEVKPGHFKIRGTPTDSVLLADCTATVSACATTCAAVSTRPSPTATPDAPPPPASPHPVVVR